MHYINAHNSLFTIKPVISNVPCTCYMLNVILVHDYNFSSVGQLRLSIDQMNNCSIASSHVVWLHLCINLGCMLSNSVPTNQAISQIKHFVTIITLNYLNLFISALEITNILSSMVTQQYSPEGWMRWL